MRILIAEDDLTSRILLTTVLKKSGFEVSDYPDGAEAFQALQLKDAPQIAILDWMMPKMDGLSVVTETKKLNTNRYLYFIMLTTKDEKENIISALNQGANDYLTKPFDTEELIARVRVGGRMIEAQNRLAEKIVELEKALEEIQTLRRFIPICANCKKIRHDEGYWEQIEVYLHKHSNFEFSHSICPDCVESLYPDRKKGE